MFSFILRFIENLFHNLTFYFQNPLTTIILLLFTINAVFGRYYYGNEPTPRRQYYDQRYDNYYLDNRRPSFPMRDSSRQQYQRSPSFRDSRFTSFRDSRFPRFRDFKRDEPNINRPLPIPLKDAIRYVRQYGPHADMLRAKEEETRNYKFSDAVDHFRNKNKRSETPKCQRRKGDPSKCYVFTLKSFSCF